MRSHPPVFISFSSPSCFRKPAKLTEGLFGSWQLYAIRKKKKKTWHLKRLPFIKNVWCDHQWCRDGEDLTKRKWGDGGFRHGSLTASRWWRHNSSHSAPPVLLSQWPYWIPGYNFPFNVINILINLVIVVIGSKITRKTKQSEIKTTGPLFSSHILRLTPLIWKRPTVNIHM